jgi:molecular chaperone GrpE
MTDERYDEEEARREVRVTDRRRVRLDDDGESGEVTAVEETQASEGDALAQAKREAAEYLDHLQRLKAEFDNYRKRVLREQTRAVEAAVEPFLARLLEVLDEFELALVAAEQQPELEKFRHGVEMVYAKLASVLRDEGLERIDAEGKPFDPELHEALFSVEGEGEPFVSDVLRSGYTLRGRVVRPSGVKIERR